jgi:hypothetical protein
VMPICGSLKPAASAQRATCWRAAVSTTPGTCSAPPDR